MKPDEDILAFGLKLNREPADKETNGESITSPGLPPFVAEPARVISTDCVSAPEWDLGTAKKPPP